MPQPVFGKCSGSKFLNVREADFRNSSFFIYKRIAMDLTLISLPPDYPADGTRLEAVLSEALAGYSPRVLREVPAGEDLRGQRLLFAVPLGEYGINSACTALLRRLRSERDLLEGCTAAIITDGGSEFYTKSAATELALAVNLAGSALIGRPLVEATGSLANFRLQAKLLDTDVDRAYRSAVRDLIKRLCTDSFPKREKPELLALHASSRFTSNTMQLWSGVRDRLGDSCSITEIGLRNGTISDCSGCPYTMCIHFGERGRCFYGGLMQEEVWPAVLNADALMMVCPNYNDALSANLTAFINRMTGLFRQKRFYDKAVFAIIVSGYSGGDIVARQLIAALNMNKSFYLPPRFAMIETANDPGEAVSLPGINERMDKFAQKIIGTIGTAGTF